VLLMRLGLTLAAVAALLVSVGSWLAGYPTEVAILRGLVAFGGISLVAYLAELVVATTPPPHRERERLDLSLHPPLEGDVTDDTHDEAQAA